jgi:hypothetical protein
VSYNRKELLLQCLEHLAAQRIDRAMGTGLPAPIEEQLAVMVVDNASTDGTKDALAPLIASGAIDYRNTGANLGGAGGFNYGMREAVKAGIEVQTLPGATAFVPALVSSGLPCDRFCFEGFLPQKKGRQTKLLSLQDEERTMVFYESPYRVLKTLQQFAEVFGGDRQVSCCREISKVHEESVRGSLQEVIAHFQEHEPKGEFVLVVAGKNEKLKD